MNKLLKLLFLGLFISCQGDNNDEAMRAQQDRMVAEQPIQNPFLYENPMSDIEVSDEELKRFVELNIDFGRIQAEAQQKIIDILREEEISKDIYNSISHTLDMGFSLDDYDFSETDTEKFWIAKERIKEVETEVDNKFEAGIEEANFSMDRFLDLNFAAKNNVEVMERAREIVLSLYMEEIEE